MRADDLLHTAQYFDGERRNPAPTVYAVEGRDRIDAYYRPGTELAGGLRAGLATSLVATLPATPGIMCASLDHPEVMGSRDRELLAWMVIEFGVLHVD